MTYSAKDLERAEPAFNRPWNQERVAQLIADVRREALEEAARVADAFVQEMQYLVTARRAAGFQTNRVARPRLALAARSRLASAR